MCPNSADIRKFLVDGRQFFSDDPSIAKRNLPAEIIERVEVFDRMSDQAGLTGFDDGQKSKAINIVTRLDSRSGQFGIIELFFENHIHSVKIKPVIT